jgi:hypothetical protein
MRDKKRKEKKLLEEAYGEVCNEMNLGPAAQTASGALGSLGPAFVAVEEDPLAAFEGEECGGHVETDIATLAAQAIAAITELATAAGAARVAISVSTCPPHSSPSKAAKGSSSTATNAGPSEPKAPEAV